MPAERPPTELHVGLAERVEHLQRIYGNRAVSRLVAQHRLVQRQPAPAPAAPVAMTATAERELDAKWNVDTSSIDPGLADRLLAKPSISITIYEAYETGLPNDAEFVGASADFAKTYQTVGLSAGGKRGPTMGVGVPIAVRDRGDLAQAIQAVHRTMHRLAEGKKSALATAGTDAPPTAVRAPLIETVAIFAHGIRRGLGLDPQGERGGNWLGVAQVKGLVAAIRGSVAGNVRFLLFACSAGASEQEQQSIPAAGATGGAGSFAAALAAELGGEATVYAHNVGGHTESNPRARVFTADSATGREMFNVMYDATFLDAERTRVRKEKPDLVEGLSDAKLTEGLRAAAWAHYTDAVATDFTRINTKSRHFKVGGYGGVGAAMFMDPSGTATVLREDFGAVWLTSARIKAFPR